MILTGWCCDDADDKADEKSIASKRCNCVDFVHTLTNDSIQHNSNFQTEQHYFQMANNFTKYDLAANNKTNWALQSTTAENPTTAPTSNDYVTSLNYTSR